MGKAAFFSKGVEVDDFSTIGSTEVQEAGETPKVPDQSFHLNFFPQINFYIRVEGVCCVPGIKTRNGR